MSDKISSKSVYDSVETTLTAEGKAYDIGTPVIDIGDRTYDIKHISAAMLQSDEDRGFPASVCLKAMQHLAGYTSKVAVKTEETEARQKAEEERLKKQAEYVDPLLLGLQPMLSEIGVCDPSLITSAEVWVSLKGGESTLSFTFPICKNTELTAEALTEIAEGMNIHGIGLDVSDEADEGIVYSPSVKKATGTRAKGTAILVNGLHRLNEGKALEGFTGGFIVHNGRIHVQGAEGLGFVYESGKNFLSDYTTEEGINGSDRPWGFPSKVVASVSSFVGEDTEMYKAFLQWNATKATPVAPEGGDETEADKNPSDAEEGAEGADVAPSNEGGETPSAMGAGFPPSAFGANEGAENETTKEDEDEPF